MKAQDYPPAVLDLIAALRSMPGIGSRGAERHALWFLRQGRQEALHLAEALTRAAEEVGYCPQCGFFAAKGELCHHFSKLRLPRKVPYDMVSSALDLACCGDARAVRIFLL